MSDLTAFRAFVEDPKESAFVCDFDGTLAPIVAHPEDARPLPGAEMALSALGRSIGLVAILSGRPAQFLVEHLPNLRDVVIIGHYGLERLVNGEIVVDERVSEYRDSVEDAASAASKELPGIYVERKSGISVGLHWRGRPDLETESLKLGTDLAEHFGLVAYPGRMVLELRPRISVDKGSTAVGLVSGYSYAATAGDDRGDIPTFVALREMVRIGHLRSAVLIAIDSAEGPAELIANADVVMPSPAHLVDLITNLAQDITERRLLK